MTDLKISSFSYPSEFTKGAFITPSKKPLQEPPSDSLSSSESENSQRTKFFETLFTLLIKIPVIKNFTLFCWNLGFSSLQPKAHKPNLPLFNSSIEIPLWFDDKMQLACIETWKEAFIRELNEIAEEPFADSKGVAHLSQVKIPKSCYHYPWVLEDVENELETTLFKLLQKIRSEHPDEPLQLHLGRYADENPSESPPFSALFAQVFASCLKNHGRDIPLKTLHVYAPLDNQYGIAILLRSLKYCPDLRHLHLELDQEGVEQAFSALSQTLLDCQSLEFLFLRSYDSKPPVILHANWNHLATAMVSHKNLSSLSFYNIPHPPQIIEDQLKNPRKIEITPSYSSEGFCIKFP